ncbi:MAG TPA: class I SAM-dependent methyltransferase [Acidimicrobiia bacterium]|nr:class I SAM-dependent methyltransferase [Acidimicrobiia bacterium]
MSWGNLADWWLQELSSDPAYREEIAPQLLGLLRPEPGRRYLDVGCGEGRMMKSVTAAGGSVVGCDMNPFLLRKAQGPVVRAVLPDLGWVRPDAFDGAFLGLVLEHLAGELELFQALAAAVKAGGVLAVMINHPIWTAPGSSPIEQADGEILWRPGRYFGRGHSDEPAGRRKVRFYHRTLASLLTSAANVGWDLQEVEESGISPASVARIPDYAGQEEIPRLLGLRWIRRTH